MNIYYFVSESPGVRGIINRTAQRCQKGSLSTQLH